MASDGFDSDDIVNLGFLGRFYSARHVLGFYRTTSALGVYSFEAAALSDPDVWLEKHFDNALHQTLRRHPSLCYGIVDQTPEHEATFLRLRHIFKEDVVEIVDARSDVPGNEDVVIARTLQQVHAKILSEGHRKTAWRVVVLKHGRQHLANKKDEIQHLSIVFFANHAIADGLSLINFHRTLLQHFNEDITETYSWPYQVPRDLRTPVLLEDKVDLQAVDENDRYTIDYSAPTIWSGANISLPSVEEYAIGLKLFTVSSADISRVVTFCRSRKVTVTGLLHGLIVAFLARHVPEGHNFLVVTPYSMRNISKVGEDEICNHASAMVHEFNVGVIAAIRATTEDSQEELAQILEICHLFSADMAAELKRCPKNNTWAGMFGVKDWYSQSLAQLGKKRPLTYGLASLGNLRITDTSKESSPRGLRLHRMIASQSGSVTGPAFCCNCVSVAGGSFTANLTWQKGSIEDKMVEDIAEYLERRLTSGFDELTREHHL